MFDFIHFFLILKQYENGLINDFDLLIIGGYYSDNRTKIDSFLLAVLKKGETDGDPGVYHAVCKIRNGLSRADFRTISQKLQPYKHTFGVTKNRNALANVSPTACIEWANANPDFWYDPQHSIVVQIKASELVETTKYRTSHSFRFPRVIKIRWDKESCDTCTLNEFQTFCSVRIRFFISSVICVCEKNGWFFFLLVEFKGREANKAPRNC